jgi:hypothetical protein
VRGIGEAIRMESRLNESRFKALFADIDAIKGKLDEIDGVKRRLAAIEGQIEALPRVIAEMMAPRRKRKKP